MIPRLVTAGSLGKQKEQEKQEAFCYAVHLNAAIVKQCLPTDMHNMLSSPAYHALKTTIFGDILFSKTVTDITVV